MGLFKKKDKDDSSSHQQQQAQPQAQKFDSVKLKVQLKSGVNRVSLQRNKLENNSIRTEREIAALLAEKKEGIARVRMEAVLRDRVQAESLDLLVVFVEMVLNRLVLLENQAQVQGMPPDLMESICSIIYAAPRVGIPEFVEATNTFKILFGTQVVDELMRAVGPYARHINQRMKTKLDAGLPEGRIVMEHLKRVALESGVDWKPPPEFEELQNPSVLNVATQSYQPMGAAGGPPMMAYNIPGSSNMPYMQQGMGMQMPGMQVPMQQQQQQPMGGTGQLPQMGMGGMPATTLPGAMPVPTGAPPGYGGQAPRNDPFPGYPNPGATTDGFGMPTIPGMPQNTDLFASAPPGDPMSTYTGNNDDDDLMERMNRLRR
mmetsp:Transcript_1310/g.2174  ORF Transcript_1310/g.2174 Transcript_1310/m.2174 type:complete len:374 (+) Transcript_1310:280-1401(+)|eukprot:CAMPEP_0184692794 /NCGR_PEP_ID=MMETSP0313-20130426/1112_1 /TAXON_ID=2792 /ORGANISM="Porphyridium aerugineum, Strain SAG 1380-2" /LENGTH=373 /DNA_ID=CAMNT_0027150645 /DNA_START=280 /DNA_END=1401 /DNA_ORIENTATION=-